MSNFSEEGLFDTVGRYAKKIGKNVVHQGICLWLVAKESDAPLWAKSAALAALAYLVSPLDAVPDVTPVVGMTDDVMVVGQAVVVLSLYVTADIKEKAYKMMPPVFRN